MRPPVRPREHQAGQSLVLFALVIVGVLAVGGLLVDGGVAWVNRRQAQSAADLAALAGAQAIVDGGFGCDGSGLAAASAAALDVAGRNGFAVVQVNYPAQGTASHDGCQYVQVQVSRQVDATLSRVVGQTQWQAAAAAVAEIVVTPPTGTVNVNCNFCSLNNTNLDHTLLVQLGSKVTVDGAIYVNSSNGLDPMDPSSPAKVKDWHVGGDAFDIFGTGGSITAGTIQVVGGWETHDNDIAKAKTAVCPVDLHPDPLGYSTFKPRVVGNVCIHQPVLADPLAAFPVPDINSYPVRSTKTLNLGSGGTFVLDPGVYIGGIAFAGSASVTLNPGVYIMAGGGLSTTGSATISGTGVTIYSASPPGQQGAAGPVDIETSGMVTLTPPTTGPFAGMTVFIERSSAANITLQPSNGAQCTKKADAGLPQGCIGGISGTLYAPHNDSTVIVKAAGTANLQVISGKILIQNGSSARFMYIGSGLATGNPGSTSVHLVE